MLRYTTHRDQDTYYYSRIQNDQKHIEWTWSGKYLQQSDNGMMLKMFNSDTCVFFGGLSF